MTGKPKLSIDLLRSRAFQSLVAGLLATQAVHAANPTAATPTRDQACRISAPPDPRLEELRQADPNDPHINITSDTGTLGREGDADLQGNVTIRMGQKLLQADQAQVDATKRSVDLHGDVEYLDPQLHVRGSGGSFESDEGGQFEGAEFELLDQSVRGSARNAALRQDGTIDLGGVSYTACPPGNDDWKLRAEQISIDQKTRVGTGRDVKLEFKGATILYAPWITFPVGDVRKSGLLFPTIGSGSKTGTQVAVPYYWNIAP
ncbi:MAG TPA: LptA/OstA family protein, partial [Steroidobacteraceae bacterium]